MTRAIKRVDLEKTNKYFWLSDALPQFVVCVVIFGLYLRNMTSILSILNEGQINTISQIIKIVILATAVISLPAIVYNFKLKNVFIVLLVGIVALIQYLAFPNTNEFFLETLSTFVTTIFPCILCVMVIKNYDDFYEKLNKTAILISVFNVIHLLMALTGILSVGKYSMGFGFALVLPTNVLVLGVLNKEYKGWFFPVLLGIANFASIAIMGSRGALLAVLFFGLIILLNKFLSKNGKYFGLFMFILFLVILILIFSRQILEGIASILESQGISARSITMLLNENILADDGRSRIWESIWAEFSKDPLAIHGINGDMLVNTGKDVNYSHNLFLELLYSFGAIIGGILSILFAILFLKSTKTDFSPQSKISTLFMCSFFPVCMFTGSLWTEMYCWLWLSIRKRK